ncbi:hypothetical protein CDAR_281211 [Caerostris darwini]|uniref:Uncharacterized protein n=1 Tax=Caerostris darwini TaxID=1538125 RepID=A0AAV4WWW8_9ARAC|nr:hypothetical protein CDAR_281211 [Caerostris darwini]
MSHKVPNVSTPAVPKDRKGIWRSAVTCRWEDGDQMNHSACRYSNSWEGAKTHSGPHFSCVWTSPNSVLESFIERNTRSFPSDVYVSLTFVGRPKSVTAETRINPLANQDLSPAPDIKVL